MLPKILEKLNRKVIIMDRVNDQPYLERYYLFLKDRKNFPFNVFLHKFINSDPDDVHDHPWPYFTLILKGGYWEWVPVFDHGGKMVAEERYWRGAGHFRYSPAKSYHRIELKQGITCWTLFMPGPHRRDWGFLVNDEWVHYKNYLEMKSNHAKSDS